MDQINGFPFADDTSDALKLRDAAAVTAVPAWLDAARHPDDSMKEELAMLRVELLKERTRTENWHLGQDPRLRYDDEQVAAIVCRSALFEVAADRDYLANDPDPEPWPILRCMYVDLREQIQRRYQATAEQASTAILLAVVTGQLERDGEGFYRLTPQQLVIEAFKAHAQAALAAEEDAA